MIGGGPTPIDKQIARLAKIYYRKQLIPSHLYSMIRNGRYVIQTPERVKVSLTPSVGRELYDLSYFRCVKCGRVFNVELRRSLGRRCPSCKGELVQVPVHYPYKTRLHNELADAVPVDRSGRLVKAAIFSACGLQDPNSECPLLKRKGQGIRFIKRIVRLNRGRPLASLRWGCPFVEVDESDPTLKYFDEEGRKYEAEEVTALFEQFKRKQEVEYYEEDPMSGEVSLRSARVSNPLDCPFLEVRTREKEALCLADKSYGRLRKSAEPVRLGVPRLPTYMTLPIEDYTFKLNVPMEPAFRNLQGEFHLLLSESIPLREGAEQFAPIVSSISYAQRVKVLNFTFGVHYGHPDAPRSKRTFYAKKLRGSRVEIWGRELATEGLILRFEKSALSAGIRALKQADPRKYPPSMDSSEVGEVIVHSIGHLLWKAIVMFTGLNYDELGESIKVGEDGSFEFLLYDNADGGLGGIQSVLLRGSDGTPRGLDPDVIEFASQNRVCESLCESACKACIAIPSCHRGNYYLDWRVLTALLPNLTGAF